MDKISDTTRPSGHVDPPGGPTPRILIVDDHPLITELIQTRLRIEGMDAVVCGNGPDALKVVGEEHVDLVILDIMMPGMDGYEVLRHIRQNPQTAEVPVIFLTARASEEDVQKGLQIGANSYITKPFSGADLIRKVKILLEERRIQPAAPP